MVDGILPEWLVQNLGWTLVHFLWQGALAAAVIGFLLHVMRRSTANARYVTACAGLLVMAGLPVVTLLHLMFVEVPGTGALGEGDPGAAAEVSGIPSSRPDRERPENVAAVPDRSLPNDEILPAENGVPAEAVVPVGLSAAAPDPAATEADGPNAAASTGTRSGRSSSDGGFELTVLLPWLVASWFVGVVVLSLRLLGGWVSLQRLRRRRVRPVARELRERFDRLVERFDIRRRVKLLESMTARVPATIGWLKPVVLLPASALAGLSPEQLEAILAHELAHIRRYDYLINILQTVIETLLFYHPAVWWVSHRIRLEREHCCDDVAAAVCGDRMAYARALTEMESLRGRRPRWALAASGGSLLGRIERLFGIAPARSSLSARGLSGALVIFAVAGFLSVCYRENRIEAETSAETGMVESPYDHFLYVRHNEVHGAAVTDTLVLTGITDDGFELKDLYTKRNFHLGWEPLCAVNGNVYGIKINSLLAVDLDTGLAENLCSIISSWTYDDGRLYAVVRDRSEVKTRVFDFRKGAYRDPAGEPKNYGYETRLQVSPDHAKLAYFEKQEGDDWFFRTSLHVMDTDAGSVEVVGEPLFYQPPSLFYGGMAPEGPPFRWIDERTILLVHAAEPTEGEIVTDGTGAVWFDLGKRENRFATMDVVTGEMKDIAPVPSAGVEVEVKFLPDDPGGLPKVSIMDTTWKKRVYRINPETGTLSEAEALPDDYHLRIRRQDGTEETVSPDWRKPEQNVVWEFLHGDRILDSSTKGPADATISPDQGRAIWGTGSELRCFDAQSGEIRGVWQGWLGGGLFWLTSEDLAKPESLPELPEGWVRFSERAIPTPEPSKEESSVKKNADDIFSFVIATDRKTYLHHQPVLVTVTLRNIGDEEVEIDRPVLFDDRVVRLVLSQPNSSGLVDQIPSYLPERERMSLASGQTVSATEVLEVPDVGSYTLEAEFRGIRSGQELRGRVEAEPVNFRVIAAEDEHARFEAKVKRLFARFDREFEIAPTWNGANDTLQRFLAGMGPAIAPYVIQKIRETDNDTKRELLYRPLVWETNPETLPFFKERSRDGKEYEQEAACEGLFRLYTEGKADEKALNVLLSAMDHESESVRWRVADKLARISDGRVPIAFERALDDPDSRVRRDAGRYLAAAEGVDLAEWLARAAEKPTKARYVAAGFIIPDLEATWHVKRGELPDVSWQEASKDEETLGQFREVVSAWAEWAKENPRFSGEYFDKDREGWKELPRRAEERKIGRLINPDRDTDARARPTFRCEVVPSTDEILPYGSIRIPARLVNQGTETVRVYWCDIAYTDICRLSIAGRSDGERVLMAKERPMPPLGKVERLGFQNLAPGESAEWDLVIGDSWGRNVQHFTIREPGEYTLSGSFVVLVVTEEKGSNGDSAIRELWREDLALEPIEFTVKDPGESSWRFGPVTMRGQVVNSLGNPVPAARVALSISRPSSPSGTTDGDGMTEKTIAEWPADEEGRFVFKYLPADTPAYQVTVTHPGYHREEVWTLNRSPQTEYETRVVVQPIVTVTLRGTVVDEEGNPVPDATVSAGFEQTRVKASTDRRGRIEIANTPVSRQGTVEITISKEGYLTKWTTVSVGEVASGAVAVTLVKREPYVINGRAVFADGTPVTNLAIFFFVMKDENGEYEQMSASEGPDAEGRFQCVLPRDGVFSGTVWASETYESNKPAGRWRTRVENLRPGSDDLELVFDNRGKIEVDIQVPVELPEHQEFLIYCRATGHYYPDGVIETKTLGSEGGTVVFEHLTPGEYVIQVQGRNVRKWYWTKPVQLPTDDGDLSALVSFEAPADRWQTKVGGLRGRVLEPDGETPVDRGRVSVGGRGVFSEGKTSDGLFQLEDAPIGPVTVTVECRGYPPARIGAVVREGETTDLGDVVLPRYEDVSGWIEGKFRFEDGTPAIGATFVDEFFGGEPLGADGRFRKLLPAGRQYLAFELHGVPLWPRWVPPNETGRFRDERTLESYEDLLLVPVGVEPGETKTNDVVIDRNRLGDVSIDWRKGDGTVPLVFFSLQDGFIFATTRHRVEPSSWQPVDTIRRVPTGHRILILPAAGYYEEKESGKNTTFVVDREKTGSIVGEVRFADTTPGSELGPAGTSVGVYHPDLADIGTLRGIDMNVGLHVNGEVFAVKTDADGNFRVPRLVPGRYLVRVKVGSASAEEIVEVKEGEEAEVELAVTME